MAYKEFEHEKEYKSLIMQDDQWWVLADTEGKKIPSDAKDIADSSGIFLALSNPSIETWLLLHYEYCKNYGLNVDQVTQKVDKDSVRSALFAHNGK